MTKGENLLISGSMWNSELVKKKMEEDGRTTKWLARQVGMDVKSLGSNLRGRKPSLPIIKLIALHLNIPEDELKIVPPKTAS